MTGNLLSTGHTMGLVDFLFFSLYEFDEPIYGNLCDKLPARDDVGILSGIIISRNSSSRTSSWSIEGILISNLIFTLVTFHAYHFLIPGKTTHLWIFAPFF